MEKDIYTYFYKSNIGLLKIVCSDDFLLEISLAKKKTYENGNDLTKEAAKQLDEYFNKKRTKFNLPLKLEGTDFQKRVWNALLEIEYGSVATYKDIAIKVGNKKAYRAVGMANHNNKIMIVVPCHRVIASNGSLAGYACGVDIKEKLLHLEGIEI